MSTKDQWLDRCTFKRREFIGIDPATRRPRYDDVVILSDEPCDLARRNRRVVERGPSGSVYNTEVVTTLKIYPDNVVWIPDENDIILVNGNSYRVDSRQDYRDGGSGTYRGSRLELSAAEHVDTPGPVEHLDEVVTVGASSSSAGTIEP